MVEPCIFYLTERCNFAANQLVTIMEIITFESKAYKELEARGLQVVVSRIQEILTVQEQAGFQMIMGILDEDHIDYLKNKRANAPYWTTIGK